MSDDWYPNNILNIMDKTKMAKIKEEAAKLGTSYYKFV